MMPKSSSAVRPSGRTNRFPPCRSPWKIPWSMRALQEADHPGAHDRLGVDAGAAASRRRRRRRSPSSRSMTSTRRRDELGVGAGDHVAALAELGEDPGDVEHVLGLEPEVELLGDRLGEQLDQRRRVGQRGDRDAADEEGRQPGHDPEVVRGRGRPTVGRCTLTTTSSPVRSVAAVDLRDRRRGEGLAVEGGEDLVRGRPRSASTTSRDDRRTARAAPGRGTS